MESVNFLKVFENFYNKNQDVLKDVGDKPSFHLDVQILLEDRSIKQSIPDILQKIQNNPQHMINLLGLAAHQVINV